MYNPYDFTGKKILVTGASSGIGQALSIALSRQGASVVMVARDEKRLNETLSQMEGDNHIITCVDFSETQDLSYLFKEIVSNEQKLDGLVHCAGVSNVESIQMLSPKRIDAQMHVNYYAFMELVRLFSKKKYNNGGSIVGISSIAAVAPAKCQTVYSASKSAMNASVEALAPELAQKNIRINTVMPGFVKTPMFESAFNIDYTGSNDVVNKSLEQQLLGPSSPYEIANACMFLLSNASSAITGRSLYVDGGSYLG